MTENLIFLHSLSYSYFEAVYLVKWLRFFVKR
jgi:hypothetical protein